MTDSVKLQIAILDDREQHREKLRDAFSRETGEETLVIGSRSEIDKALDESRCNALLVNLYLLGADESISLLEYVRSELSHIPICVVDNFSSLLGDEHNEWNERLGHYYQMPFNIPEDAFDGCIRNAVRLFEFYLISQKADYKLRELREFVSSSELDLDQKSRNKIIECFLDVVESLREREKNVVESEQRVKRFAIWIFSTLGATTLAVVVAWALYFFGPPNEPDRGVAPAMPAPEIIVPGEELP